MSADKVTANSAAELLQAVPRLLGFYPRDSLVFLGLDVGMRVKLVLRCDLPGRGRASAVASQQLEVMRRNEIARLLVIGYGPGDAVTPTVDALTSLMADRKDGPVLHDVLRAHERRVFSYLCRDPACCPPGGRPYDDQTGPIADKLSVAGLTALPDRQARAATLAPLTGDAERAAVLANLLAASRLEQVAEYARNEGGRPYRFAVIDEGRRAVIKGLSTYRAGGQLDSPTLALIALSVQRLEVRNDAWARLNPAHNRESARLWTDVLRYAFGPSVPPVACLLALAAWQGGDGALANMAVDRALTADPRYSMALTISEALILGAPPRLADPPTTPEVVAKSYGLAIMTGGSA